jgi:hypothetical protein
MKINDYLFFTILIWVALLFNFLLKDIDAFWLFLLLPPVMGLLVYIAIKQGGVVLPLFFVVSFPGIAITPAFLFLNKDNFHYSGFSAVRGFGFDIEEFLVIYAHLFFMLLLILFFTATINRLLHIKKVSTNNLTGFKRSNKHVRTTKPINILNYKKYNFYLIGLVFFILAPLNILMYANGIGISATEPPILGYNIVGITFYFRNYISPLIIGYLYFRSTQQLSVMLAVLLYAFIFGLLSLSKGSVLITCLPVLLFAFFNRKPNTFVLVVLYSVILYGLVNWLRQFVFISKVGSFEIYNMAINNFSIEMLSEIFDIVGIIETIAFRLSGANLYVLAYQYDIGNNFSEILNFYTNSWHLLAERIYSVIFELPKASAGVTMGVSLGYLGTLFLLAGTSLGLLTMLAFITAILLSTSELIVYKYLLINNRLWSCIGYGVAFMIILLLVTPNMGKLYFVMLLSLVGLFILRVTLNKKH